MLVMKYILALDSIALHYQYGLHFTHIIEVFTYIQYSYQISISRLVNV
jgi:hypothetical protein